MDETAFDACGKLACDDLYITATDSQGLETYTIPRDPATKGVKSLVLKVASFSGDPLNGLTYQWERVSLSPNAPAFTSIQASISIAMPGTYKVTLARGTSTCSTLITIGASPCNTIADPATRTCTTSALTGIADEAANRLTDLAAGDVVQAGDFNITITEVTGTSSGWNGKGYVTVPYLNAQVNIVLQNAVFNDCYQLTNANSSSEQPTVFTAYDPNWGGMINLDCMDIAEQLRKLQEEAQTEFDGSEESLQRLEGLITGINSIKECINSNQDFTQYGRDNITLKLNELKSLAEGIKNAPCNCGCPTNPNRASKMVALEQCNFESMSIKVDDIAALEANPITKQCHPTNKLLTNTRLTAGDTDDGEPKYWLQNMINGVWAHDIIEENYRVTIGKNKTVYLEYAIPESSSKKNKEGYGYADIVNETTGEIFEIKTEKGESIGLREVTIYVNKADIYCNQIAPRAWKKGTDYSSREFPWPLDLNKKLVVRKAQNGVITYAIRDNKYPKLSPVPVYQDIPQGVKDQLEQLVKKIMRNPTPAYAELQTRLLFATLSTTMIYTLITTGMVGNIAAIFEEIGTLGIGTPAIAVQALVCTTMITVGYQILKTR